MKVKLVPLRAAHLEATLRWLGDARLRQQIDSLEAPNRAGHLKYWKARLRERNQVNFAILGADGAHVGNCGLGSIDPRRRKAELWIYLGGPRGKGTGAAAMRALLKTGFRELGLNRIYLRVVADNPGALRFYKGLGFVVEGRFRQDTFRDGAFVDSIWLSILASEFRGGSR